MSKLNIGPSKYVSFLKRHHRLIEKTRKKEGKTYTAVVREAVTLWADKKTTEDRKDE